MIVLLLGLLACAEEPAAEDEACDDVPVVTWDSFGRAFVTESCQGCHASTTDDREGAPEDVVFDTEGDVWRFADRVLARATGDAPTLPPLGGPSEDDRQKLRWWLECDNDALPVE